MSLRRWRLLLAGVLVVAVGVTSVGWYRSAHPDFGRRFERCSIEGGHTLVLDFSYGLGDEVATSFRETADGAVVGLRLEVDDGPRPAIALSGEARFMLTSGTDERVTYPDGTVLDCPAAQAAAAS